MNAEITVRVLNALPGGQVAVSAHSTDSSGQAWQSSAVFIADEGAR